MNKIIQIGQNEFDSDQMSATKIDSYFYTGDYYTP